MKGIIIIKQSYHYVYFMMRTLSGEFPIVVIKKYVYKNFLGPKIRSEVQQDCRIQPDNRRYSKNCRPSDEIFNLEICLPLQHLAALIFSVESFIQRRHRSRN